MQFLVGCPGFQCKRVCHADAFFLVFLLRKQSVSCGNLQRQTLVLGFGRKALFHAPRGESLTGHAVETAGLSGGLGSSRQDHLSALTLFSPLGVPGCRRRGGEAAVAAPREGCGGGAVPAPSHPLGLDCGFLGNHPEQSKHRAHLTGLIKAFLTSLMEAGRQSPLPLLGLSRDRAAWPWRGCCRGSPCRGVSR